MTSPNRFIFFLILALCLLLAACAEKEPEPSAPSSPTELASIVEPLEASESAVPVSERESGEPVTESEPGSSPETVRPPSEETVAPPSPPLSEAPFSVSSAPPHSPEQAAPSQAAPERLNAEVPDSGLNCEMIELELLRLINGLREEAGAEPLGLREEMTFAARIRSAEALQSFSHTRPNGSPYNTAFDEAGFSYAGKWHGENLASLNFTRGMLDEKAAALEMFNGLKGSPGHYRNMTGENFLQAGVGVSARAENDMIHIASAQLFSSV